MIANFLVGQEKGVQTEPIKGMSIFQMLSGTVSSRN